MERIHRSRSPLFIAGLLAGLLVITGCGSRVGDAAHTGLNTDPLREGIGASEGAGPADFIETADRSDRPVDRADPGAVALAFVNVATNRRISESREAWLGRMRDWSTDDLFDSAGVGRSKLLDNEIADREGRRVGLVVGYAVTADAAGLTVVDVVCDETVVFEGQRLEEQNFVSWRLGLKLEADGWRVFSAQLGGRS